MPQSQAHPLQGIGRAAESGRAYRAMIEHSQDMIIVVDAEGRIQYGSPSVERQLGYSPDDYLGRSVFAFVHPDDRERTIADFRERSENPGVGELVELRIRDKQGGWRIIEHTGSNLFADPNVQGLVINLRDITSFKVAQRALRDSEETFRSLFDSVTEAIYVQDHEGRFLNVNTAVTEMTGYSRAELIGRTPELLADPDRVDLEETREHLRRAFAGEPQRFEWWGRRKNGECFPKEVVLSRATYFGETVVIAVAREVTERMQLEAQLRQAQKMEAIGRLAGGIAHDFNNLMMTVSGYSEFLLEDLDADNGLRDDVEEIRKAAERATSLTQQLLAFSRRQVMRPDIVDLNAVVRGTEGMLRRLIGEDVELATRLDPALEQVEVDGTQIEQVIMNLAVNARDAMPEGGTLTIATSNVEIDEAASRRVSFRPNPGRYVRLSVADTGHGIDAETQGRIFEPFFTTKDRGKGTGLGLSTVYGIVKQSSGYIWVESEPGTGATFHMDIPSAAPSETVRDASGTTGAVDAGRGDAGTVLVVEDEDSVRRLVHRTLQQKGYEVLVAATGEEALRLADARAASSGAAPFDLLLTDIVMPDLSGQEVASRIGARWPDVHVILMSGYTDDEIVRRGIGDEDFEFLAKPFAPDELIRRIAAGMTKSAAGGGR